MTRTMWIWMWTLGTLTACGQTFPDPDCDAWELGMTYDRGIPVFTLDVPALDGEVARRVARVSQVDARGPIAWCNTDFRAFDLLWEVAGRFDELTYGQTPEDAQETWNVNRDRPGVGLSTRLQEGQLYVFDTYLTPERSLDGTGCGDHQIVWIHGDPASITNCVDVQQGEGR
ncbi:MAG: hypothetical protein KTR31_27645 [Myxococcales bacterium]|nr:hypothetical protein [Myxococcales bacterium]